MPMNRIQFQLGTSLPESVRSIGYGELRDGSCRRALARLLSLPAVRGLAVLESQALGVQVGPIRELPASGVVNRRHGDRQH